MSRAIPWLAMLLLLSTIFVDSTASLAKAGRFNCGEDPHGTYMCACIGAEACAELHKSTRCQSGIECHSSQLGTIICSCKAMRSRKRARTEPQQATR